MLLAPIANAADQTDHETTPESDRDAFVEFFKQRFPDVAVKDYVNGIYALDQGQREQWEEIEEFPPYEFAIDEGKELFETPFANGKTYADCFKNGGIGIRQDYPYFDQETGQVKTLELEINECREQNGEKPLKYKKGAIAAISAYMASTSRGKVINSIIPDDPKALAAYENGKEFYYAKRGQLNFSCADCHVQNAGNKVRADQLSAGLGHPTHFPVYRSKWGEMGTLHRRFGGCNKNIRATPLAAQSEAYRNLEYFLSYMSNGLEVNGPGARK
jgi:sulfur-oxidizing protein SoxA